MIPISGRHYLLPVTGERIGALAYLTDFNGIDDRQLDKLRGVDVLVINALLFEKHIFTGGAGASTVRLLPALCLTRELADRFLNAFKELVR